MKTSKRVNGKSDQTLFYICPNGTNDKGNTFEPKIWVKLELVSCVTSVLMSPNAH